MALKILAIALFVRAGFLASRRAAPAAAIALQAALALAIAFTGCCDRILSYVVSIDFTFFGLTGAAAIRMKTGSAFVAFFSSPPAAPRDPHCPPGAGHRQKIRPQVP
jgi:hypothetical protein